MSDILIQIPDDTIVALKCLPKDITSKRKHHTCSSQIMHMNHSLSLGFISFVLLISLTGVCIADDAPGSLVYIQGGESSIVNGSDGVYVITVKDIVPYFHIADGEKSNLIPVERLNNSTSLLNAALVLSSTADETVVMVRVVNLLLSDGNKVLTLQVDPLGYYEGALLTSFNDKKQDIDVITDNPIRTGVFLENIGAPLENDNVCTCICSDGSCDPKYTGWLCGAGCPR